MSVEWYAAVVTLVGISLWFFGSVLDSVIAMLFFTMFGGGAAFVLGHATIVPASFAFVFVFAHLLLSMFTRSDHTSLGLRTNNYFALFAIYGAVSAIILPRLFARVVSVSPLSGIGGGDLFLTRPVHFSSQNITTALYLLATFITSICAGAAAADPKSRNKIVLWAIVISWFHVFFGVAGAFLSNYGGADIIKVFRNATYAELSQDEAGLTRLAGVFPEPSAYAGYAFGWFVFMTELWLRNVATRWALATVVGLGAMLIACTSSTGYLSLAVYVLIMLVRFIISPHSLRANKVIPVVLIGLAGTCAIILACALFPHMAFEFGRALKALTLGKADTASGRQRLFWLKTGIDAIKATWGLGIGAGSFRSSSLLIAILGGIGWLGLFAFGAHVLKILKPFRRDTYELPGERTKAIGVAAAWSATAGLIPPLLASPTPDPGYVFAIMGGLALGWRYQPRPVKVPAGARRALSSPSGVPGVAWR
jgi:hypothetical protein